MGLASEGKPQEVANAAWAMATLGCQAPTLFGEIDQNVDNLLQSFNLQDLCNTCCAIAILGLAKEHESTLRKLWEQSIQFFVTGNCCEDEGLRQLTQAGLFANAEGVHLQHIPEPMSIQPQAALKRTDDAVSRASMQISQLLNVIGFDHETKTAPCNAVASGGMLAIDMACIKQKIAIEFDGPTHYLKAAGSGDLTKNHNGATKAKRQFLERLNWTAINLDFRDYIDAKCVSKAKEWLRAELRKAGVET